MNISSILITIIGIIIILGLYVLSRVGQHNLNNKVISKIPDIKDQDGNKFSSVLDDIPASDGDIQIANQENMSSTSPHGSESESMVVSKKQIVLFISAKDKEGLDGSLVKQTLINNGLKLGDKDIYHYFLNNESETYSLFRIANGVEPWTLKDDDLIGGKVIGISIVMLLPTTIKNKEATQIFMEVADKITMQVNGVLKNQKQELLSNKDRSNILES